MGEWEHAPEFPPRLSPLGGLQSSEGTGHQIIAEAEVKEQQGHHLGRADGFGPRRPGLGVPEGQVPKGAARVPLRSLGPICKGPSFLSI